MKFINRQNKAIVPALNDIQTNKQKHPTTVFCKISVREVNIAYNFILLEDSKNL